MKLTIVISDPTDAPQVRKALMHAAGAFDRNGWQGRARRFRRYAAQVLAQYHDG